MGQEIGTWRAIRTYYFSEGAKTKSAINEPHDAFIFFEVDALVVVVLKEKGRFVSEVMDPILANHRTRNESHEIKVVPFTFYAHYPRE